MMKDRYAGHEIQHGLRTLEEFLDDLQSLNVLPEPQPVGMEPETYMCAANMGALMVTFDDGRLVCDVGFRNVPSGCPELLGIVGEPTFETLTAREIGKSLVLDVLYGAFEPADVRLLTDGETTDVDGNDSSLRGDVGEQEPEETRKYFVSYEDKQYEVVRKFMQRKLSSAELAQRKAMQEHIEKQMVDQAKPEIMTDAEIVHANLEAFYSALSDAGITGFIGFHDCYAEESSHFEGIRAVCGQKLVDLPAFDVRWAEKNAQGRQGEAFPKSIRAALYNIVDDVLHDIQEGYNFASGTDFQFRCDVKTREFHIKIKGWDLNDTFLELELVC